MGVPWIMETSVLKESGAFILIQGRPFRFLQHINGDVDTLTWLRLTMMTTLLQQDSKLWCRGS